MNWIKAFITGIVGGVVLWLYNFLMHGLIMAKTYEKYEVFREDGSPFHFVLVMVLVGFFGALLFAKTRSSWAAGIKGGIFFGLFIGMFLFFYQFMNVLLFEGFPYYLSWCWGGIVLIGWIIYGAVAGVIIKE